MLSVCLGRSKFLMDEYSISTAVAARLVGIPASRLLAALRDERRMDSKIEADLLTAMTKVSSYADALGQLPLPTTADALKKLIESPVSPDEVRAMVGRIFA